jgi:integrase
MPRSALPKYVKPERRAKRRRAPTYYYFRKKGFARVALPGLPYSPEFMEAYHAALAGKPIEIGSERTVVGTINDLIVRFYKSYTFTKNKPITRQTDRNILEAFRARHGDKRIRMMERRHILAAIAEREGKPAAQRNLLRVLRVLLGFAVEQGMRADNPALGIKLKPAETAGFHSWTEGEVRQYEQYHPIGTKARLALALLLYTAQRRTDVVRLGPPSLRDGRLIFVQSKTGADMDIPLAAPLAEVIAKTTMIGTKT